MKITKMKISKITINKIRQTSGIVAFASIVIDDSIKLNGIAIHQKYTGSGYRITYPTRKGDGNDKYLYHPLSPDISKIIEKAIFDELKIVLEDRNDRHDYSDA